jgi:SPP1 gp7 family putative phage head morphogenesis protein
MPKRLVAKKTDKVLTAVRPNVGIEAAYREKLQALIADMDKSVVYWLRAAYRANEPVMAQDRTPADELRDALRKLAKRWQKNFDEAAPALAEHFAQSVASRSSGALMAILKKAGFTVKFRMTPAMRDIMAATVGQQVSLIKSIPSRYFTNIEGLVMRSVQTGRDLGQLTADLQQQFDVTRRRAAFIARDQNNKATASMTRARQDELGITQAIWVHSGAGKHPRPTHVAMNGKKYDVNKGMWDSAVNCWIFPGEEINCRCISRSIIPGFS